MGKMRFEQGDWIGEARWLLLNNDPREQWASIRAQACIAMHNAEREQERTVINIPSVWIDPINKSVSPTMTSASYEQAQPQPFDCEEAKARFDLGYNSYNGDEKAKIDEGFHYLYSYVRSLGYPVKE